MAKSPAYPMYAQDYDMDTATWDNYELGMYQRLLNYQWINGNIPADVESMAKICRCSVKKFNGNCKNLFTKLLQKGDGYLQNKRMEEERIKQQKYKESQQVKGKKSAKKRWGDKITTVITAVTNGLQPESNLSFSSSSSSSLTTKKKNNTMFIKPSLEEVKQYCKERNKGIDPEAWYDHYLSNGWKVGKAAISMKDWKATVRTWERNPLNKQQVPVVTNKLYTDIPKEPKIFEHEELNPEKIKRVNALVKNLSAKLGAKYD